MKFLARFLSTLIMCVGFSAMAQRGYPIYPNEIPYLRFTPSQSVTLVSDAFTRGNYTYVLVDGEGAASDNLATINGGRAGDLLWIQPAVAGHVITIKNGTGNIYTGSGADYVIPASGGAVMMMFNGTSWTAYIPVGTVGPGSGDVVGPAGVTADSNVAIYSGTTGKIIKDSKVNIDTNGVITSGVAGADGGLKMYSEQGATDYLVSWLPNSAMTSDALFYMPADEPAAESWLTMGTDGVIDYTAISTETLAAVTARGATTGTSTEFQNATAAISLGQDVAGGTPNVAGVLKLWSAGDNAKYLTLTAPTVIPASMNINLPDSIPSGAAFWKMDAAGNTSWDTFSYVQTGTDTLGTVTANGASTATLSTFTGGLTLGADDDPSDLILHSASILRMYDDSDDTYVTFGPVENGSTTLPLTGELKIGTAVATDDKLTLLVTTGGAASIVGNLTAEDLTTGTKTWQLPDFSGYVVVDATKCTDLEGTGLTITAGTLNVDDAYLLNTGDTGTGAYIFNTGADGNIGIVLNSNGATQTADLQQWKFNSSAVDVITATGNVGIGTSTPIGQLQTVISTTEPAIFGGAVVGSYTSCTFPTANKDYVNKTGIGTASTVGDLVVITGGTGAYTGMYSVLTIVGADSIQLNRVCHASGTDIVDGAVSISTSPNLAVGTNRTYHKATLANATGNEAAFRFDYTANKATSGNDTGIQLNMTDTASPGTSLLMDLQVGGGSMFSVNNTGYAKAVQFQGADGTVGGPSHTFYNDTNTGWYLSAVDTMSAAGGGVKILDISNTAVTDYYPLNLTAVAVNGATPSPTFQMTGASHGSSTPITGATEAIDVNWNLSNTKKWATAGIGTQRDVFVNPRTYAFAGGSTVTTAATIAIGGPPKAGANATNTTSSALLIQGGEAVIIGGTCGASYGLTCNAPTGATANYAAQFVGGNVSFANGTVALPSIFFDADTDTGFYSGGANILAWACAGTQMQQLDTTDGLTIGNSGTDGAIKIWSRQAGDSQYIKFVPSAVMTESSTYTLPVAKPASNKVLQSDSSGILTWETMTSGVTGFTGALNTASPNDTNNVSSLTASGGTANQFAAFIPKGTGGIIAAIPDSAAAGGNVRGTNSVDLQTSRSGATMVASGASSAIGGGANNISSGASSTVCGGNTNTASTDYSFVGGGQSNEAKTNTHNAVVCGINNDATGGYSIVGSGNANVASGSASAVLCGVSNTASGAKSTVINGDYCAASGSYSTAVGKGAVAYIQGQIAQAGHYVDTAGDAQLSRLSMYQQTTNATQTELRVDGSLGYLTIASEHALGFTIYIFAARQDAGGEGETWKYKLEGTIRNVGGTTSMEQAVTKTTIYEADANFDVDAVADNTNDRLAVKVTGAASKTVRWIARLELEELNF